MKDKIILEALGLTELTEQQRSTFLPVFREELETRIGKVLSKGMSDSQLREFETIIDSRADQNLRWLESNQPDYKSRREYWERQIKGLHGDGLINEMACSIWLKQNCPNYKQVVKTCLEEMRNELTQYKEIFLGNRLPFHMDYINNCRRNKLV